MGAPRRGLLLVACLTALILPATATAATQTLTVEKNGTGTGTVTSSPAGIECGGTCSAPFSEGSTVVLSGVPGANSTEVVWAHCTSVNIDDECFVKMSAAKSVTATFDLQQRQLTLTKKGTGTGSVTSEPAGIECGATCSVNFTRGELVTLSATPGPNTQAVSWSGCDSVSEGKCKVTMSVAKAVTATFNLISHQLSVAKAGSGSGTVTVTSSPAGIECGGTCQASYLHGTTVTLTATPGPHVEAAQWTGCGSVNGEGKCIVTMSEAKSVSASFALEAGYALYPVAILKAGTGQGTVTGSVGSILCGSACTAQLLTGTTLTLSATPSQGSVFAHWSGGGCKGAGPCTTTVKGEKTIKAVFTAVGTRTLSVTKAGTGQGTVTGKVAGINCGATCASQVPAAKKVTLSAKAAAGSTFAGWSGACSGTKACKVQMSEARSVTATFTSTVPPPAPCVVPALKGKSLKRARSALEGAHCSLGKVSKPKARAGRKLGPLTVRSSTPPAGTVLAAGAKVDLRLGKARRRRHG